MRREEATEELHKRADSFVDALLPSFGGLPPPEASEHRKEEHPEDLSEAEQAKARQEATTATLGQTFIHDAREGNAFPKLSRYETTIERSLYKALHELQRLPAGRPRDRGSRTAAPDHRRGRLRDLRGRALKMGLFGNRAGKRVRGKP